MRPAAPDFRAALDDALDPARLAAFEAATVARLRRAAGQGRLVLAGSGPLPRRIARAARAEAGRPIAAFAEWDPARWGAEAEGAPVLPPAEALARAGAEPLCVAAVWSPGHAFARTAEWLRAFGATDVLPVHAAFWAWHAALGAHYQLGPAGPLGGARAHILAVHDALCDPDSRAHYAGAMLFRAALDASHLPAPRPDLLYHDRARLRLPDGAVVVDAGAHRGATLDLLFRWQGAGVGRVLACEPDPISHDALRVHVAGLPPALAARVEALPVALGAVEGTLRLTPSGLPGTVTGAQGEVEVPTTTVDALLGDSRLDFLKLDTEGAEAAVLDGAARALARERPSLGLSIYHRPDDAWALAARAMRALPGHAAFCRMHDEDGIDLVLTLVKPEHAAAGAVP